MMFLYLNPSGANAATRHGVLILVFECWCSTCTSGTVLCGVIAWRGGIGIEKAKKITRNQLLLDMPESLSLLLGGLVTV